MRSAGLAKSVQRLADKYRLMEVLQWSKWEKLKFSLKNFKFNLNFH